MLTKFLLLFVVKTKICVHMKKIVFILVYSSQNFFLWSKDFDSKKTKWLSRLSPRNWQIVVFLSLWSQVFFTRSECIFTTTIKFERLFSAFKSISNANTFWRKISQKYCGFKCHYIWFSILNLRSIWGLYWKHN